MGNIIIDGRTDYPQSDADVYAYNGSVAAVLKTIKSNLVGRLIVMSIEQSKKDLTIVPFDKGKAAGFGDDNAVTRPDNLSASAPEGKTGKGDDESAWYIGYEGDRRYLRQPYGAEGTGAGSDVHIFFTPDPDPTHNLSRGQYGSLPDESLVHEMVHGLRSMQGKVNQVPTKNSRYRNEEDFLAIVVTNVYMSANNKVQLRADHFGFTPLKAPLDTSAGFLADAENLKLMNIYKLVWQPTFWYLANQVPNAKFNPFRELTERLAYLTGGARGR